MYKRFLPLIAFLVLGLIFFLGLKRDPHFVPSTLISKEAPKFTLPLLVGNGIMTQKKFLGKSSILVVWASWCQSCIDENEFLLKLKTQNIPIYGLNYKDSKHNALQWLKLWGNPFLAIAYDAKGLVATDFGVYGAPEVFLIDSKGIVRYKHIGILNLDIWNENFAPWF